MTPARPALLYVEDEPRIGAMTAELLADDYEVDWCADGEEGLRRALRRPYDLMLLDRRLPGIDGVELARRIRRARIRTPILMLTALGAVDDVISGLDGGANDYLRKPYDFGELRARLRALHRGFEAEGARRDIGDWTYLPDTRTLLSPTGGRVLLTEVENRLLELLSGSPEHVFSRDEVRAAVFADSDNPGVVDTYVHYLRRKSVPDLVDTVRGLGYRLGAPE